MKTPVETVREWFDRFAVGDVGSAAALLAEDAPVSVMATTELVDLRGFEAFVGWYARRRAAYGESFAFTLDELLCGPRHACALITLTREEAGRRISWQQVALYDVEAGVITAIRAFEGPEDATVEAGVVGHHD